MSYEYNKNTPEITATIAASDQLRQKSRQLGAAYQALMDYRDGNNGDTTFNQYFMVTPSANPMSNLEDAIAHGLILTCPNVRDQDLPGKALESRARAVAVAVQAANAVEPTQASRIVAATAVPQAAIQ
jgi:hypothetical protein